MRLMPISACRPGMKLGKRIFNDDGIVLLAENVELTDALLKRLEQAGINFIYVQDPRTDDIQIKDLLSEETLVRATKTIRTHFRQVMEESRINRTVVSYDLGKSFRRLLNDIIDELYQNDTGMIMLSQMQMTDHYLYQHSLNVCIYATLLGIAHGYNRQELGDLGMGALLHDIGKTKIPLSILQKPGRLTDEEYAEIQKHTKFGYDILKEQPNVSLVSAHCAYQHHERIDGSGYPRGISGNAIHEYARWIGLVDSYDAMTASRVYKKPMLPHQALEVLYTEAGVLFDKEKVELFRDKVAIYPLGVTVRLSTGESGVVVDLNAACPQRPIVRIFESPEGEELKKAYEVDLSKHLSVMITEVLL